MRANLAAAADLGPGSFRGPAIASLPLEGFGHTMVKHIVAQALGGKATIGFPPNGFVWSLSVPSVNAVCESASNHNIPKQFRI
jgi:hypothetical protein